MTSIVEVIQHYQRSIDSSQENEARLLHCINKLYKLPIKVEHLQETGIGKTVNSLRKFNGEIGVAAKTLVTKWKAMVAAEEEPMDTASHTNENETSNDTNGDGGKSKAQEKHNDENHNSSATVQKNEESKHRNKDNDDKHKQKRSSSSSSNAHKDRIKQSSSTSLDHKNVEKTSKNATESHKSSSRDKHRNSGGISGHNQDKERQKEKEKREHKSSRDRHKERDNCKEKERRDKNRDDKHKAIKESTDESRKSSHSPEIKTSCSTSHASSSKTKNEEKHKNVSSSKDKERSNKHKSSSRDKERSSTENHSVHSSSSKEISKSSATSSSSKSAAKEQNSAEHKRRRNSDNDSNEFKSPQPKVAKLHKSSSPSTAAEDEGTDECFDSSMGANFDDVLGMLNMPVKRSKKSLKSPSTTLSNNSSATKKDANSHRQATSSASSSSSIMSNKVNDTRMTLTPNASSSYPTSTTLKTIKPDLLAPTAKLEPLDPSIALELPSISTNYKPMPLNQTVMDCVFNNSFSTSKPVRTLSDAEAIAHGISSKTMRTKIYSGMRTGQTFQVPTLFDMCIRLLQKNIDALEYTGGVPFEVLKPVLERATPQQLYAFEEYNPYLMEDSDVLWQQHVSRTYRTKKRIENESWREMFIRCQEEQEQKLSVLKDSIKASQKMAAAPVRKTQLAFVDSMVKPPRNVLRKQEQFGTKAKLVATPAARVAALSNVAPNAAKMGDQRLKVPTAVRDHAQVSSPATRPKKAPLMQKTLQFIRGRHKR